MIDHFKQYFNNVTSFFSNKTFEQINECYLCKSKNYNFHHLLLRKCNDCGFVWLSSQPTQEVLNEFYEKSEAMTNWSVIKSQGLDDERQNNKYRMFWDFIKEEDVNSVMDVGCGTGYFLDGVLPGVDCLGIEPNKDSARHCNVPIITDPKMQKHKFDLVTFFGVLEHLKDPRMILNEYDKYINNSGFIGVIVPNIDSLAFDILGQYNCTICPQHLWYFSLSSLSDLFNSISYSLVKYTTVETEYQPIVRKLYGIDPYNKLGGIEMTHPEIREQDILKRDKGAKVCAIFQKNKVQGDEHEWKTHSDNTST